MKWHVKQQHHQPSTTTTGSINKITLTSSDVKHASWILPILSVRMNFFPKRNSQINCNIVSIDLIFIFLIVYILHCCLSASVFFCVNLSVITVGLKVLPIHSNNWNAIELSTQNQDTFIWSLKVKYSREYWASALNRLIKSNKSTCDL